MVAQTSILAHQPHSQKRKRQVDKVFQQLNKWVLQGFPLTVPDLALQTGIKVTTVHARINDLKTGYTDPETGVKYWAVEYGTQKLPPTWETFATWTLVTADPVNRAEQKQRIINRIKRDAALLRQMKAAELRELKNLFDDAE